MKLMDQIKPENAEILIERYFEGKTFPEIGKERFITARQAQRREYAAIREFQQVLDSSQTQEAC